MRRLNDLDASDVPSCLIVFDARCANTIHEEVNDYDGGTMLIPYCGGFGIDAIRDELEFDSVAATALDLYQGRFKTFRVKHDERLLVVFRYVEWNRVRASLCQTAEEWRECSTPSGG